MKKSIENQIRLAKYLAEIHSHSLENFYYSEPSSFWEELEEESKNEEDVDKKFFIEIAKKILLDLPL